MNHTLIPALLAMALFSGAITAQAACPTWSSAQRFEYLNGGTEVKDKATGLVWARCSVGQNWDGRTCIGSVRSFTHEAALQYAAGQSGWRMPNIRELGSLADKGCAFPSIDVEAFPATESSGYWSSSPSARIPDQAMYTDFRFGQISLDFRDSRYGSSYALRLVRVSQ